MRYDAFICHATEDKEEFVRPLAERLRAEHVEVWYDEFSLKVGDGLRRSIDLGLSQSRFGIVVLSPAFFGKRWSNWELDGLVARQNAAEQDLILPVWRGVNHADVLAFSPPLADKMATPATAGIDEVARGLVRAIRPQGSTLVSARDQLIRHGLHPPVISDDWWLDMAAAAEGNDVEGTFQEAMGWGRWGFPLPEPSADAAARGWRIARAALQVEWQRAADGRPITQVTPPDAVHEFMAAQPGLAEACRESLGYLLAYAPQIVIPGFGGEFENRIEDSYRRSLARCDVSKASGSVAGTGLTIDGQPPTCDEDYALRDPGFGGYDPASVACAFVQGRAVSSGPPVRYYSHIDYLAWLLSEASCWLPDKVRHYITVGMAEWGVWTWNTSHDVNAEGMGYEDGPNAGMFGDAVRRAREKRTFKASGKVCSDLSHRLSFSAQILNLPEPGDELAARVLSDEFLTRLFEARNRRRKQRTR